MHLCRRSFLVAGVVVGHPRRPIPIFLHEFIFGWGRIEMEKNPLPPPFSHPARGRRNFFKEEEGGVGRAAEHPPPPPSSLSASLHRARGEGAKTLVERESTVVGWGNDK